MDWKIRMPWYIGTVIGVLSLVIMNSIIRHWDIAITPINVLKLSFFLYLTQIGFWYGFRHSPHFTNCWFVGTAFTAILGVSAGILLFDKNLTLSTWLGVGMVLMGAWLLVR